MASASKLAMVGAAAAGGASKTHVARACDHLRHGTRGTAAGITADAFLVVAPLLAFALHAFLASVR